jgi:hypothetical protein
MKKSKIITFNGEDITAKELTIAEINEYLSSESSSVHTLDIVFHDRLPVNVIERSTGLKAEDLEKLAPSSLLPLWDAVEDVNPFFLSTLKRLADLGREVTSRQTMTT